MTVSVAACEAKQRLEEVEVERDEIQSYNEYVHIQKKQLEQENEALKQELYRVRFSSSFFRIGLLTACLTMSY